VAHLRLHHSSVDDRFRDGLHRSDHGHRRRLPARADAHLFPARADQRGDRHLDGAHPGHHGDRHRAAFVDQPLGRRHSGADPDGRRRIGRAVRRARRAEDAWRAAAPAARPARARGRYPLRDRSRAAARGLLFDPHAGGAAMRWAARALLLLAVLTAGAPARAERLVSSLSSYRVLITSSFTGTALILFGTVEAEAGSAPRRGGYDLVATGSGPRENLVVRRKERVFGIWVNVESRTFVGVPSYLATLSTKPVEEIANIETL